MQKKIEMVDQNTIISMTNANFTESTYTNNNKKKKYRQNVF